MKTNCKNLINTKKVVFLIVLLLVACSKEVKMPSEETMLAREAMEVVFAIKDAYMKNNKEALLARCTSEEVLNLFSFASGEVTGATRPEHLEFIFKWVDIYDSKAEVYVSWKAKIAKKVDALSNNETKGFALFVLEGRPFKLKKILRENPFTVTLPPIQWRK